MEATALIGLDWGTSTLRARRLARDGSVLEQRPDGPGIMQVSGGGFEQVFYDTIGDWLEAHAGRVPPVIASGMIGSRQGWLEAPYATCPADAGSLGARLAVLTTGRGHRVHLVPGVCVDGADGVPDVMRGEETEITGAVAADGGERMVVLPGTHSKWVRVSGGRITSFATFMTGEVFGLLCAHSILGRLMQGRADDAEAFERGVRYGASEAEGGLLKRLFSARTLALFDRLAPDAVHAYLSGLLVGAEIREALSPGAAVDGSEVLVIGGSTLAERYVRALAVCDIAARRAPDGAAARGQVLIARGAGLLEVA